MIIVGIDEAGRGCWAGPLVAAAVILYDPIDGLNDSKKLTRLSRFKLEKDIYEKAIAVGVGMVDSKEIDNNGLTKATKMAMKRALVKIKLKYDKVIIDGNYNYLSDNLKTITLIKADSLIPCVSAASIIAKTYRDRYMIDISEKHPNYHFDKHVGYGTALHAGQLQKFGICQLHRLSFKPIQELINKK